MHISNDHNCGMALAIFCKHECESYKTRGAAMNEPMIWVMWYLMLSGLPLVAAAMILKQLIIGYGEPVQPGTVTRDHTTRKIAKRGG